MFGLIFDAMFAVGMFSFVTMIAGFLCPRRARLTNRDRVLILSGLAADYLGIMKFVIQDVFYEDCLGGGAVHGKIEGDEFYFGEHGRYTPVSKSAYWTSYYVWRGLDILFLLAVMATVVQILLRHSRCGAKVSKAEKGNGTSGSVK